MTDPWDDAGRSPAGIVVTAGGLRVPVCAPAPAGWPAAARTGKRRAPSPVATEARYRGVGPQGYQRSDARVHEQVCERLLLDPYLDASRVVVQVANGRVTLTGAVQTERMRDAAVAAATSVAAGPVDARIQLGAAGATGPSRVSGSAARRRAPTARKRGGRR